MSESVPIKKLEVKTAPSPLLFLKQTEIPHVRHSSGKEREHKVVKGDTLYGIAWRYDLDPERLAQWNSIRNPDLILRAEKIRLTEPYPIKEKNQKAVQGGKEIVKKKIAWVHPYKITDMNSHTSNGKNIKYLGVFGDVVRAAADGLVVYSGSGLRAYGELVIIKHDNETMSAYAHNSERFVTEGDYIKVGGEIGRMGKTAAGKTLLHFEIRVRGRPVDPTNFLPPI